MSWYLFEEINAPKACSIADLNALFFASSSVLPVQEVVKVTMFSVV
jgi:hypothetical protein